jgi:hypothetical protein
MTGLNRDTELDDSEDEPGEIVFGDEKSTAFTAVTRQEDFIKDGSGRISKDAKVVSSEQHAPQKDLGGPFRQPLK